MNLGELLLLPDEEITRILKDKIIIVGDFMENDMHETLFETTSGPLILTNVYLALQNPDTLATLPFVLILLATYLFSSFLVFHKGDFIEEYISKKFKGLKLIKHLAGFTSYLLVLLIASTISFFLFNIHINVFLLAVYLYLIDLLVRFVYRKMDVH